MAFSSKNEVEYEGGIVTKTFHPRTKLGIRSHDESFRTELAAYQFFEKIRWGWAPNLLEYDFERKKLRLQRINGRSLTEMITRSVEFDVREVISQLLKLDRLLWLNRINCLQINSDDIVVEEGSSKIYMIDFEHTYLNSRYKKILCNQILGPKLYKIEDNGTKSQFISSLLQRRKHFHKYHLRTTYILYVWLCRRVLFRKKGDNILK
jgi:hypothetical protein